MSPSTSEPTHPRTREELRLVLRKADPAEIEHIFRLLDDATAWLKEAKSKDQWATGVRSRKARIRKGVRAGHTWIAWDGEIPVATLTLDTFAPAIWARWEEHAQAGRAVSPGRANRPAERALYVHRLIVRRDGEYTGRGIGAELLDWAAARAADEGLHAIRIDVWTTNVELHQYYIGQGFKPVGIFDDLIPDYPASALFERPAKRSDTPRLTAEDERSLLSPSPRGAEGRGGTAGVSVTATVAR